MEKKTLSLAHNLLPAKAPDEKPPLLLMLHGYGSHENDLFSFAPMVNEKATVVSLRAPMSLPWGGFAWYEIDFNALGTGKMSNTEQARESMELIRKVIGEIHEAYGTDPQRVWLVGFSQGAILSYGLSLNYPKEFGKVLALSGYILKDIIPEKYKKDELQHLDYFLSHGTQDEVIPVEWAQQSPKVLEQLGVSHQYREYPMGHGINPECFEDLKLWMWERDMI